MSVELVRKGASSHSPFSSSGRMALLNRWNQLGDMPLFRRLSDMDRLSVETEGVFVTNVGILGIKGDGTSPNS